MDPYYYARRRAMQEQAVYQQQQMLYQQQMQYQQQQAYQQQRAAAAGAMFGAMYNDTHCRAYGYGMQGYGDEYAESSRGSRRDSRGSHGSGRDGQQFHGFVEDDSIHSDDSDLRRGLRRAQGRDEERGSFDGRERLGEAERRPGRVLLTSLSRYSSYGPSYDYDAEEREPSRGGREPPRRRFYGEDSDSEDGYGGGWGGDYPSAYVRVTHRNWR
ncbi:hypothetical protein LTR27_005621 [Elasticomyces elasticus]|nr:hypothetical protein LTR27_005621 [Elasticomyces elasticus]